MNFRWIGMKEHAKPNLPQGISINLDKIRHIIWKLIAT